MREYKGMKLQQHYREGSADYQIDNEFGHGVLQYRLDKDNKVSYILVRHEIFEAIEILELKSKYEVSFEESYSTLNLKIKYPSNLDFALILSLSYNLTEQFYKVPKDKDKLNRVKSLVCK